MAGLGLLVAVGGLALAGWILTRSAVLVAIFESSLSDRLGGAVEVEDAGWVGWSGVELSGVTIRADDLNGAAGDIASIDRLQAVIDVPALLLGGGAPLSSVVVDGGMLRITTNVDDPTDINIGHLFEAGESGPGSGTGSPPSIELPGRIDLSDFVLEFGEFEGSGVRVVEQRRFDGRAVPGAVAGVYDIVLEELDVEDEGDGVAIRGTFNRLGMAMEAVVTGINLAEDLQLLPAVLRSYFNQMDIEGDVVEVDIGIARGESPRIAAVLRNVGMSFPSEFGLDSQWARFENRRISSEQHGIPRMVADEGVLIYNERTFRIEGLQGRFVGDAAERLAAVDFNLDLAITSPFGAGGSERSFSLDLRTDEFHLGDRPGDAVRADLPLIVAQILAMFEVITCDVSIALRATGRFDDAAVIDYELEGRVGISDASGAYEGFRYPLEQLDAQVGFNSETVTVHSLDARGAGDSKIGIAGHVVPLGIGSEVDLTLTAVDLPLDAALMDAVPDEAAHTLRSLFGRHGARVPADRGSEGGMHELVDLDLDILRDRGPDQPTRLQGRIGFEDLDLTWSSFPYPITLLKGSLTWHGDILSLEGPGGSDEVEFTTPSGTRCKASGFIHLPTDDQQASGVLDLMVVNEPVTRDLVVAMDRLSPEVSDLIESLQLEGSISVIGPVEVDSLGHIRYGLMIRIRDGSVEPRDHLAELLGARGAFWPSDLVLESLDVELFANERQVEIKTCTGASGPLRFDMMGDYHLVEPELTSIDAQIWNATLQERLLELVSGDTRRILEELYERWSPRGRMDVEVAVRGRGEGATSVRIDEADLSFDIGGEEQGARIVGGALAIRPGSIVFEDLELDGRSGEQLDGQYGFTGAMRWGGEEPTSDLRARVVAGRFESPILNDLSVVFAGREAVQPYLDARLRGRFDAEARVQRSHDASTDWSIDLTPKYVEAVYGGAEMAAEFDRGLLAVDNGLLSLEGISGVCRSGAFAVSGDIVPGDVVDVDLRFDYDGAIRSPEVLALLPDEAAEVLDGIDFIDGGRTAIRGGRLRLGIDVADGRTEAAFEGDLMLDGASLDAGVDIEGISGRFGMRVAIMEDASPEFGLEGVADSLRVLDKDISQLDVRLQLDDPGTSVVLETLSGDLAGGEVFASGQYELAGDRNWFLDVLVADASLSTMFPSQEESAEEADTLDGRLYAGVSMSGSIDGPGQRFGRGTVRIYEGEMGPLPVVVGVYQILQLSMPIVEAPQYVSVDYHQVGDEILLDRIRIESQMGGVVAFSLTGEGSFDWESKRIDAVLRPRSGWAVISDLVGAVLDQFYAVGVEGPIDDPDVFIIPFPEAGSEDQTVWVAPL